MCLLSCHRNYYWNRGWSKTEWDQDWKTRVWNKNSKVTIESILFSSKEVHEKVVDSDSYKSQFNQLGRLTYNFEDKIEEVIFDPKNILKAAKLIC